MKQIFSGKSVGRPLWMAVLGFVLLAAAGCTSGPTETAWGQMRLIGDPPQILFSFNDRISLIDPLDGQAVALRDENGRVRVDDQGNPRLWEVRAPSTTPAHFYTNPIETDDATLLAFSYERHIFEIDRLAARILNPDGVMLSSRVVAEPLMTDTALYVPLADGGLVSLNPNGFAENWRMETSFGVWAEPLLVDNTLYVSSMDHFLYALDATNGTQRWKLDLGGAVASQPLYQDGFLYIGSFARKVFKISTTGEIVTSYDTGDWVWGTPSWMDGILYTADLAGNVFALRDDGNSFSLVWTRLVATRGIRMTPLIVGDRMLVGSRDHFLYWVNRDTGAELLKREMRGEVLSDLLLLPEGGALDLSEPLVIASTLAREELLVAFTLDNGERRWVYGR